MTFSSDTGKIWEVFVSMRFERRDFVKKKMYCEICYILGLMVLAIGTAFMEKADFGMSMVVAPAYLIHRKLVTIFPWFSFGVAEYTFQAVLLLFMILLLRRFEISYLFSFVTAVVYGVLLDLSLAVAAFLPVNLFVFRLVYFLLGVCLGSVGVAFLFHTYIAPEVYELFVKEWAKKYGTDIGKTKTVYDCISCGFAIALSFLFFGFLHFEGVKLGTVVCALTNGWLIGKISQAMSEKIEFHALFHK